MKDVILFSGFSIYSASSTQGLLMEKVESEFSSFWFYCEANFLGSDPLPRAFASKDLCFVVGQCECRGVSFEGNDRSVDLDMITFLVFFGAILSCLRRMNSRQSVQKCNSDLRLFYTPL